MKNSPKPHWLIDLSCYYIRTLVFRQRIPLLASFKLSFRCNLECLACPFHQRSGEPGAHMSWDTAIATLAELKARGCRIVIFEGGEPLLWHDGQHKIADLVQYARKHFLRVAVTTNGTLPLTVPADIIWVSLDGLRETHNRLRSNSFDRIWKQLHAATHPRIYAHTTLHRENWTEYELLAEQLMKVPQIKGMTVQLFYPYNQGETGLTLTSQERIQALETVIALKRRGYPILNSENRLRAMMSHSWNCRDDVLINVDPDGTVTQGCYAKNRGRVHCRECGFTPVAEASGALQLLPGSVLAGWKTYIQNT